MAILRARAGRSEWRVRLLPNKRDGLLATLRPFYFSAGVPAAILAEAERHLSVESPRALFDLSLRLHMALPERPTSPVLVLGAQNDRI